LIKKLENAFRLFSTIKNPFDDMGMGAKVCRGFAQCRAVGHALGVQ